MRAIKELKVSTFHKLFYLMAFCFLNYHLSLGIFNYPLHFFEAQGFFRLFPFPMPSKVVMIFLYLLAGAFLLLAAFRGRSLEKWISFILCFYIFGIRYNYGFISHNDGAITIALGIMALARSHERWPIPVLTGYWVLIFFLASLNKFVSGGLNWAQYDSVAQVLWQEHLRVYPFGGAPVSMPLAVFVLTGFSKYLSWHVFILELLCPLMLLSRTAYWIIFPQLILMLVGFQLSIGRNFLFSTLPLIIAAIFYLAYPALWIRHRQLT